MLIKGNCGDEMVDGGFGIESRRRRDGVSATKLQVNFGHVGDADGGRRKETRRGDANQLPEIAQASRLRFIALSTTISHKSIQDADIPALGRQSRRDGCRATGCLGADGVRPDRRRPRRQPLQAAGTLPGRGKSGSTRTIIAAQFAGVLFFLYGFEKNDRDNITAKELALYQRLARELLDMTEVQIATALAGQVLTEVTR